MRKIVYLLAVMLFASFSTVYAQRTITGTVTAASDGIALPGVTVQVKGATGLGTMTDPNGKYSLSVPEEFNTLVFSFVGMQSVEQAISGTVVNASMSTADIEVDEVVVTALGIARDKKSLGYSVQEVSGDAVNKVRETNFVSSLSGKVAGVNIKAPNTMGGSANVVIRGSNSLLGNNQALFVVDGVPIDNSNINTDNQQGGWGGYDYGNAAMDINPDDIESISVLKGAAAAALYGSRASNGVILVTTKKGSSKKGIGVTINSGFMVSTVDKSSMPQHQDQYGGGYGPYYEDPTGNFYYGDLNGDGTSVLIAPVSEDASWGAKFDPNVMVVPWYNLDPLSPTYGETVPWVAPEDDYTTFFETGMKFTNNVAFNGGFDKGSFRFSYTNVDESGILPNSSIVRNTVSLAGSYELTEKFSVEANMNYVSTEATGRFGTGYDGNNVMQSFGQWFQTNVDFADLEVYENEAGLQRAWNYHYWTEDEIVPYYFDNPYWVRYKNFQNDGRDRFFGYAKFTYDVSDWLTIESRVSKDYYSFYLEERIAVGSAVTGDQPDYTYTSRDLSESNADIYALFNKNFGDLSVNGLIGTGMRRNNIMYNRSSTVGGLIIPDFYSLANSVSAVSTTESFISKGINSIYSNVSLGFQNFAYLEVSARQDMSSTLPDEENQYFYPSVSTSIIVSELIDVSAISFAKVRVNWAKVGNDAPAYQTITTYSQNTNWSNTGMFSVGSTLQNENLKPETSTSIEAGAELRLFDNRLGFDVSAYKTNTLDQILPVSVSRSSGYSSMYVNVGEIENKGLELTFDVTPIKTNDLTFNIGINWYTNENMVVSLNPEGTPENERITNILLFSAWDVSVNATEGEPYGTIKGTDFIYDGDDHVIGSNGFPLATAKDTVLGNVNPDWNMGILPTLTYKGITISGLIDIQKGGSIYSVSTKYGMATGVYEETAEDNDLGNPLRDPVVVAADGSPDPTSGGYRFDGVLEDGTENNVYVRGSHWGGWTYYNYLPTASWVFDASYVKLRELSVSYSLPSSMISKTPFTNVALSLVGRNLAILYKVPDHFDPEAALSSGNQQGIESGSYPTTRSIGFNIKLGF